MTLLSEAASSVRDNLPWWTVETLTAPAGGQVDDYEIDRSYWMTVDRLGGDAWRVYLMVFNS